MSDRELPRRAQPAIERLGQARQKIVDQLSRIIVGQSDVIEELLIALFSRSHCLLEGVPGLAKTLMISTLSRALNLSFSRIQFTPDLMPADVTGTEVIEENRSTGARDFRFLEGPIFSNVVLADEINRTPPKTQAALLEAMQERQVTVGRVRHRLADPFFVLATQNPIEQEGTYPLPEAQLDRFMFNVWVDYPSPREEELILTETTSGAVPQVAKMLNDRQLLNMQKLIAAVPVSEFVVQYTAKLVRATRPRDPSAPEFIRKMVDWGAGPRAGQYLILGAKAFAAMDGRYSVSLDDIQRVAIPVLRHRIGLNFAAQAEGIDAVQIVNRLLDAVPEPELPKYETPVPEPSLPEMELLDVAPPDPTPPS